MSTNTDSDNDNDSSCGPIEGSTELSSSSGGDGWREILALFVGIALVCLAFGGCCYLAGL